MMTDERQGNSLFAALSGLPRGAGVVFRHYRLEARERRALFLRVKRIARRRGLILVLAGKQKFQADGYHGRASRLPGLRTASVHDRGQLVAAQRAGADCIFVSPIFPSRSHPGKRTLGPIRFGLLIRGNAIPVVALGGMNRANAKRLRGIGIYGWAAIDAWSVR